MFAPVQVQQRVHVEKWVRAAMIASQVAINNAIEGNSPVEIHPNILEGILQSAVKEIMKMGVKPNVEPSNN